MHDGIMGDPYDWVDDPDIGLEESRARLRKLEPATVEESLPSSTFGQVAEPTPSAAANSEQTQWSTRPRRRRELVS